MMTKEVPKLKKYCMATTVQPMENFGSRKYLTSTSGCSERPSHLQNPASSTTKPTIPPTTSGSPQPRSGPSMSAETRPTENRTDSRVPTQSILALVSGSELGTATAT